MGKKRQPLRKIPYKKDASVSKPTLSTSLSSAAAAPAQVFASHPSKQNISLTNIIKSKKIDNLKVNDDVDLDHDETSENGCEDSGDIHLDADVIGHTEDYTFQFNDMRESYAESITTMLRNFICNSSDAYTFACHITQQSTIGSCSIFINLITT